MRDLRLAIDIGGTFTDSVLMHGDGSVVATAKTLTTPDDPTRGALEGADRVLAEAGVGYGAVARFVHGTTLATNALIERRGTPVATVTTEGFRDILEIAYERRYAQYDIGLTKPDFLVPRDRAFTLRERVRADGSVDTPLDADAIAPLVAALDASGAGAVAVCLLHAYANPAHELALAGALQALRPGLALSLSHQVSPEAREFDRLTTTIANAYIQPMMAGYLAAFASAFAARGLGCPILMMTAGGGMTTVETAARYPIRLVESGPAGGAVLAAETARAIGTRNVLSFDMGGTTAKLCLIDDFTPQTARAFEIARAERFIKGSGMPVRIPVVEMVEIGAGGGSMAGVDRLGRLTVGPQSAGSLPGPAAFGRGGTRATVTDADVVQGFIDPDRFAEGRLAVDEGAASAALVADVGAALGLDADASAGGVSDIVDENMAAAARMHAVESGKDLGARVMIAFGGNGPLHATRVARRAGVGEIVIPPDPGVGSAVGFLFAPVSYEIVRSKYQLFDRVDFGAVNALLSDMADEAETIVAAGAPGVALGTRRWAFMRYRGQGHEIEIALPDAALSDADLPALAQAFEAEYARQFSRIVPGMAIEILNWRLVASADRAHAVACAPQGRSGVADATRPIRCDLTGARVTARVIDRARLLPGETVAGPALITEPQTTTLVSADFTATTDAQGNLRLTRTAP